MPIEIKRIINSPIDSNCYIIFDKEKPDGCIIVDPGSKDNEKLIKELERLQQIPEYIILTHEHYDHCWGVNAIRARYKEVKLVCSNICSEAIQKTRSNYSHYCCDQEFTLEPADIVLELYNWEIKWGYYRLLFVPAKGHSASGIFMVVENALFTGDTLIKGVRTSTKFKTGSIADLNISLEYLISCKGKQYVVYPGHGDSFLLDEYDLINMKKENN